MAAFITKNAITAERAATAFSFLAIPMATPMGEKQGKVVKHHRAAVVEHGQQGVKNRALAEDGRKPVGFYHSSVGERPAYAKEQPGHGKYGYGEHKGSADTLQYAENLVSFILIPPDKF